MTLNRSFMVKNNKKQNKTKNPSIVAELKKRKILQRVSQNFPTAM